MREILNELLVVILIMLPIYLLAFINNNLKAIAKALKKQNEMYRLVHNSELRGSKEE